MTSHQLTTGSISKHIADMAVPASIGLFFQTMYNVVDSFYAGEISTSALAALGLSFPVYLMVISASSGLSRAAAALIANAIGSEEIDKQKLLTCQSISLGILISLVLAIVGNLVAPAIFRWLGASGQFLDYAIEYMTPIFWGTIFFIMLSVCNSILIAQGDSKTLSKVLIVGFFLNLILDPWFLYGGFGLPAMGIFGIALATVVIQILSSAYMLSIVIRRGLLSSTQPTDFLPRWNVYQEIIVQAIPASFNTFSVALGFIIVNYYLKSYGESAIAAFGVTTRIEQIGLMPTFGLYAAILALVGQNNGAKKYDRVLKTVRLSNWIGFSLSLVTSALILIFSEPLIMIFTDDQKVVEIGKNYIFIMMFIQWSYVVTSTHLATLQAMKRPFYGFFETTLRKILLPAALIMLFLKTTSLELTSVWLGMAIANVFMTFVTVWITWNKLSGLVEGESSQP